MASVAELIKNESHPEVLRGLALFVVEQSSIMALEIEKLREEIKKKEVQKQIWLSQAIRTQLHKLQRQIFVNGRESLGQKKRNRRDDEDQLLLHAQSLTEGPADNEIEIPQENELHFAEGPEILALAQEKDPDLTADQAEVEEIDGFFETSTEITVTERIYKKVVHKRQKYRVKNKKSGRETIITAPGPLKLLPGCRYSVDFALSVVAGKFLNHMPYERQRRNMKRVGLSLPVITMYRLSEQVAVHAERVAEKIRDDIFAARHLAVHLDETRWPILSNHDDDGQMWILSNQAGSYYRFEPTRSGQIADELLKGFEGALLTDKYSGYLQFRDDPKREWGLCWAHARREFLALKESYPEEVSKVVAAMDDLFDLERVARTWSELKAIRQSQSKKKCEEIKGLLERVQSDFFDQDDFCKAARYVLSAWKEFTAFIDDVRLPLSNNDAERALRHAVLGRKNFNGSKTINGADTAAILYSVIESCKKVELDPVHYLKYVITENQNDREPLTPLAYAKGKRCRDG